MAEDYKCQVSFTVKGVMINIRGESDDEVNKRAKAWLDRIEPLVNGMQKNESKAVFSPAGLQRTQEKAGCLHKNATEKTGTKNGRMWQGEFCNDCGAARFLDPKTELYGSWNVKKK